jgi:diguanylate cyclase (GGDEF)-like protein/PAS domain S-box-containing protein
MTAAFRDSEERYRTIIASLEDAYFETDVAGNLVFFNDALVRLLGYPTTELNGMNNRVYMDDPNSKKVYNAFNRVYTTGEPERGLEWEVICKSGERRYVEASISLMHDPEGGPVGFRGIARDVTERRRADERIHHLAHYDALTGLPNRTLFEDRMRQVLKRRWQGHERAALLFIDLDRFKTVNDTLGHHTGDELLKLVARRIEECVREGDTVCRPGGDEFLVLLGEVKEPTSVAHVGNKILQSVAEPYSVEGWELTVTPSIGVAIIPDDGNDIDTLTRNADTAMYHAKDHGRNNFQFFSPEMNANAEDRLAMENDLRRALERNELELYYQPIVDVKQGRVVSAEALLRWHRPDNGLVVAGEFIEVVEQSGLILPIGEWVIGEACRQAKAWGMNVAVNLSGLQLRQHTFADTVARLLEESGLEPSRLELEITESVLIEDVHTNIGTIEQLYGLGVRFSIDDFGTGYSSLSYLKRFPIEHVKIDRSFIRDLVTDAGDAAIINAIIKMSASLQMSPVAEGVETDEQRDYLRDNGCTLMQGYLFGRPMPAAEFGQLLAGWGTSQD